MNKLVSILFFGLLAFSGQPQANGCFHRFVDDGVEPAVASPPEGFTKDLVLDSLEIEGDVCGWAVKPWGRDGLHVAVVEQEKFLTLGVFEKDDSIRLRARGRLTLSAVDGEDPWQYEDAELPRFHHFDFAPYKLSADQTAIGIRVAHTLTYPGGGGRCENLMLLRLDQDRLTLVLHTLMDYEATMRGEYHEDIGIYGIREVNTTATLAVLERATKGVFDLVKSMKFFGFEEGRNDGKVLFQWAGDRYALAKAHEPMVPDCLIYGFDRGKSNKESKFPDWIEY